MLLKFVLKFFYAYLVVNAADLRSERTRSGKSLRAVDVGNTPGWLIHWSIFHLKSNED